MFQALLCLTALAAASGARCEKETSLARAYYCDFLLEPKGKWTKPKVSAKEVEDAHRRCSSMVTSAVDKCASKGGCGAVPTCAHLRDLSKSKFDCPSPFIGQRSSDVEGKKCWSKGSNAKGLQACRAKWVECIKPSRQIRFCREKADLIDDRFCKHSFWGGASQWTTCRIGVRMALEKDSIRAACVEDKCSDCIGRVQAEIFRQTPMLCRGVSLETSAAACINKNNKKKPFTCLDAQEKSVQCWSETGCVLDLGGCNFDGRNKKACFEDDCNKDLVICFTLDGDEIMCPKAFGCALEQGGCAIPPHKAKNNRSASCPDDLCNAYNAAPGKPLVCLEKGSDSENRTGKKCTPGQSACCHGTMGSESGCGDPQACSMSRIKCAREKCNKINLGVGGELEIFCYQLDGLRLKCASERGCLKNQRGCGVADSAKDTCKEGECNPVKVVNSCVVGVDGATEACPEGRQACCATDHQIGCLSPLFCSKVVEKCTNRDNCNPRPPSSTTAAVITTTVKVTQKPTQKAGAEAPLASLGLLSLLSILLFTAA